MQLEKELLDARAEAKAARSEVVGTERMGSLLVAELVERIRIENKEGWSPEPILGFRMWVIRETGVFGAKTRWRRPKMTSACLNRIPGEDLPHGFDRCGPPACGIYATKSLAVLRRELGVADINGYMVGLVGMTGKVVEHDRGYRAAEAEAVAVALSLNGRHLMTDDECVIADLFADPARTIGEIGVAGKTDQREADEYLERWKEENESWTWEQRSE